MVDYTEKKIEQLLIRACQKAKIECVKSEKIARGFVDRIVFNHHTGEIHFLEIKGGFYYQQTKHQKDWEDKITKCGGKYFYINGVDEMQKYIENYIKRFEK